MGNIIPISRKSGSPTMGDLIAGLYSDCGIPMSADDRRRIDRALTDIENETDIVPLPANIAVLGMRRD